jgi:organic hydroperoxide reductase OsmC/OhrA
MAEYTAEVTWQRGSAAFLDEKYSRGHLWRFDGGIDVPASASPHVVRPPLSVEAAVDPEEALVAALSSCHMLWFLSIAAKHGFVVDRYRDEAVGVMGRNAAGKIAITRVTLRPAIAFAGPAAGGRLPAPEELDAMHQEAHAKCFIANSVTSEVRCEPRIA